MSIKLNQNNFENVLDNIVSSEDENNNNILSDNGSMLVNHSINNEHIVDFENGNGSGSSGDGGGLVNKIDAIILTNGWNDKNEKLIISIGENSASYKWMHEKSNTFYGLTNSILSILLVVFSTGLSIQTVVPDEEIYKDMPLYVLRTVFTYVVTILSVVQNFLKYEKLAEKHKNSAVTFGLLYHDIQKQMCMYRSERRNAAIYLSEVLKKYDNLILSSPTINHYILKNFKKTFKDTTISVPDIADKIQKIEIITEPIPKQINKKNIELKEIKPRVSNLQDMCNVFKIDGDISDNDIKNIKNTKSLELHALREKYFNYELNRFKHI